MNAGLVGGLAEPVRHLDAATTASTVDRLFRRDAELRAVVVAGPDGPVLIERSWLDSALTGRLGFGRVLNASRAVLELGTPPTIVLPSSTTLNAAAAMVLSRQSRGETFDAVLINDGDHEFAMVRVTTIFERLADDYGHQSRHDALTGLPNRLHLMQRLAESEADGATLLYIDLDRFKDVNDRWGHAAGDALLVAFGQRLLAVCRPGDFVARLGGDEFALLTEDSLSRDAARALAERVVDSAAQPYALDVGELDAMAGADSQPGTDRGRLVEVGIGASVGIAEHRPDRLRDGAQLGDLLRQADLAMYRAKARGRGRVAHYDAALQFQSGAEDARRAEREMERKLRGAITDEVITVAYQPVVELPSGRVYGVEALARWHDADLGQVPPDVFITLAERTGLIIDLGRLVLRLACTEAAAWPDPEPGQPAATVAVNISAVQLAEPLIVDQVAQVLASTGLAPERLCLEITETAAVQDLEQTAHRLAQLRDLGVRLALDDFGTGHSSLTMLRRLPVHLVKIDRSFVERVTTDALDAVLVRLVIDTAHSFGLRVCAEGIETMEQGRQLTVMGADSAQGWLFGRPMAPGDGLTDTVTNTTADTGAYADLAEDPTLLLGGNDELVLVITPALSIRYASASSLVMLGWTPAELIGTSLLTYLDAELVGRITRRESVPGVTENGGGVHRVVHRDGTFRWLSTTTQLLYAEDGSVRELLSISRDVTVSVTAEEALARSESEFRHAFDDAPIGIALNALDGGFLRVNRALAELLGYTTEELLTRNVAELTHPDDLAADVANTEALLSGRVQRVEVSKRYRDSAGRDVPVRVWASLAPGPQDGSPYIVAHVMPR